MCVVIKNLINSNLPIVTELFMRGRKLNVSLAFIPQFYFDIPKYIRLNFTHYFIMKISNKQELQQIAFEDFMNIYKKCTAKKDSFSMNYTTLAPDNPLRCRHNLLERI